MPKRPKNAFMVFRSHYCANPGQFRNPNAIATGALWRTLWRTFTAEQKAPFMHAAAVFNSTLDPHTHRHRRPTNGFIVFRAHCYMIHSAHVRTSRSHAAAAVWRTFTDEEKEPFVREALGL